MNKQEQPIAWLLCESDIGSNALPPKILTQQEVEYQTGIPIEPISGPEDPRYNKPRTYVEAVLQTGDMLNRNKRIYSSRELEREIMSDRVQGLIRHKMMKGEAGHPLDDRLDRQQTIDPKLCEVIYLKMWFEKPYIKAILCGTYNKYGDEFEAEVRNGATHEFSSRSLGTVRRQPNGTAVVENMHYITSDVVIFQSDFNGYARRIVSPEELKVAGIKESAVSLPNTENNRKLLLNEACKHDICTPIYNDTVINYIKEQSQNIKTIKEQFDIYYDSIKLLENGNVSMTDKTGNVFIINLESYIRNEIMNYATKHI